MAYLSRPPNYPFGFYDYTKHYRLSKDGCFVFGSNLSGRHGKGAAKEAHLHYDAKYGVGEGFTGRTYAIPTKGHYLEVLTLKEISYYVEDFVRWTITENRHAVLYPWYFVTPVGTGLAGFKHHQIAPMFKGAVNCWFPDIWEPYLH